MSSYMYNIEGLTCPLSKTVLLGCTGHCKYKLYCTGLYNAQFLFV